MPGPCPAWYCGSPLQLDFANRDACVFVVEKRPRSARALTASWRAARSRARSPRSTSLTPSSAQVDCPPARRRGHELFPGGRGGLPPGRARTTGRAVGQRPRALICLAER
jgi:hypothetical protein